MNIQGGRKHQRGFAVHHESLSGRAAHTQCGFSLLASLLTAAVRGTRRISAREGEVGEKDGLGEPPEALLTSTPVGQLVTVSWV